MLEAVQQTPQTRPKRPVANWGKNRSKSPNLFKSCDPNRQSVKDDILSTGFVRCSTYMKHMTKTSLQNPQTTVLYNAECPVCNFEISHYAKYSEARNLPIRFDDLNGSSLAQWGLDEDVAARRLYVTHEGKLYSGIPAFLVLWQEMPRYRWLAKLVALPGIKQLASAAYDYVLAPAIYQWHLIRKRRRARAL